MKILLVNPSFPNSYWSGRSSLAFAHRRSLLPPLGLITVAALLPQDWDFRLIDMDVEPLRDEDLTWADAVMLSGMLVQRESLHEVLARCKKFGVRTIVGGPYATALPQDLMMADHVVAGEGEDIIPELAADLMKGRAKSLYREEHKPDLTQAPIPRYDLLDPLHYNHMSLQYSRGCPFSCEFCDIIVMYGRLPRIKTAAQVIAELEAIKATGFSGSVFFVDDNFIGNKKAVRPLLLEIASWRKNHGSMLEFYTEASMNIADDLGLVDLMTGAGFTAVFIGIETPSPEALKETRKTQNLRRNLIQQVHDLLNHGLDVWAGFILGFDSDTPAIFDQMTEFIHKAAIPYAMIGMLGALPNTPLYHRLEKEGRILNLFSGDHFGLTNFKTVLSATQMGTGYQRVLESLYSAEGFFARCRENLARWTPAKGSFRSFTWHDLMTGARAIWGQGFRSEYRLEYWRFLGWVLRNCPEKLKRALTQAGAGHHYITYTREIVLPRLQQEVQQVKMTADYSAVQAT